MSLSRMLFPAAAVSVVFGFTSCFLSVQGTGPEITKSIDLHAVDELELDVPAHLTLITADSVSCVIKAQQNIIDLIDFDASSDELEIKSNRNYRTDRPVEIYISMPALEKISLNGSGNIQSLNPVKGDVIRTSISGSGDISLTVLANELRSTINGSGDMHLAGKVSLHKSEINGSGNMHAGALNSETCKISINGSGDAEVDAASSLNAHINGSGSVTYTGSPAVDSKVTGSGEVKRK